MSCINPHPEKYPTLKGYRPREGYELHPLWGEFKVRVDDECYRPREGYELHLDMPEETQYYVDVTVPVRGMSCIFRVFASYVLFLFCYRPREGYELHRQK